MRGLALGAALGVFAWPALAQQAPEVLVREGRYGEAIEVLGKVPRSDSGWVAAQRELARALLFVGRYDEAERVARQAAAVPGGRALWNTLGEVLLTRGRLAAAESAFVRAGAERAPDSLTARLNLAVLHYGRGERARALGEFDHFIDVYNAGAARLTSAELTAVAVACRYLGTRDPQLFKDALRAFDRAIARDPNDPEPKIRLAELFLEKYNSADAQTAFDEVLRQAPAHPRALLGEARRRSFDGQGGVDSLVARALEVNPEYVDARVFRARLLLDIEDYAAAQREVERALRVNPSAREALAVAAAIRYLTGDRAGFEAATQRALALHPRDADLYATLAELAGRVRLYAAAADLARQGVAADSTSWRAHGLLGMNLLRLGQIAEGRRSLETAFRGDPYDVWIKNTLDLLDTYRNYDEIATGRFRFLIEKSESALLGIYLAELAERAHATFAAKYGYTPPPPIRVEVYRSHADFSVRTVGLAGLGALGVSFGTTLAFDSPAAKDAGPFNWGSTVWHELAHTFTLGATEHRVPRWLSEGLSVYEEHKARSGWGFNVTPAFLKAFQEGRLVPVSRLNDGFMRPAYPEQVQFSYYQASLVCDFIARDWGEQALLGMLRAYTAGQRTEQVVQRVLGTSLEALDKRFDAYVRQRFATALASLADEGAPIQPSMPAAELRARADAAPRSYRTQLLAGRALLEQGATDAAIPILERARALFPEAGGSDAHDALLARAYKARSDVRRAADALARAVVRSENDYAAHLELAGLLEQLGDARGAADALDRAIYINPFEFTVHERLAELARTLGEKQTVVRERRAVLALGPVDRAEALYRLALAYHEAGDAKQARTTVLRALEEAPNYERAQELLLTLVEARSNTGGKP
jgi:tetratricopeptide (TPR) repeat protein